MTFHDHAPAERTNWFVCIGIILLFLIPYDIINHLQLHRYTIPFILGEERVPFLPWTLVIYLSFFLQGILTIRIIPRRLLMNAMFLVLCMEMIGLIMFVLLPIEYPRNLYQSANGIMVFFRRTDLPGNCFPSLHVAITLFFAGCFSIIERSKMRTFFVWIWTIAIVISVLTTKQHYLIDIFGGIALTVPFIFIFRRHFAKLIS